MTTGLDQSVTIVHPYAKRLTPALRRLGIASVGDLLAHLPVRHEDLRMVTAIGDARVGADVVIHGRVTTMANRRSFRRHLALTEALIRDATGSMRCVWFRQPYLAHAFPVGSTVAVAGTVAEDAYGVHLVAPDIEYLREVMVHTGRLVPVYSLTAGISQKQLRLLTHAALSAAAALPETLPRDILAREHLLDRTTATREAHFPTSEALLARARERFAFEELFTYLARVRAARVELDTARAPRIPFDEPATKALVGAFPFRLTDAQRRAAWAVLRDMAGEQGVARPAELQRSRGSRDEPVMAHAVRPMQRLLNGDVGSGKTVVAAIAAANVARAGMQAAYLAPTDVLAVQQARSFTAWLRPLGVRVALWTQRTQWLDGEPTTTRVVAAAVRSGEVGVVIGTHALLTPRASFPALALAIVDEQHRFGVEQRAALRAKSDYRLPTTDYRNGNRTTRSPKSIAVVRSPSAVVRSMPHLLSMTATPIPRTLNLALLGDLEVSVLDELPSGRSPITTTVVSPTERRVIAQAIRTAIAAGHQAYVVCPAIDPAEDSAIAAVTDAFDRAQRAFPHARVGLLHGKLRANAAHAVMDAFAGRDLDILVTTTVIEVGMDQPNATVMVIEDADRFGLAQLHQLRGRVGRGVAPGRCFLCTKREDAAARARLDRVAACRDGFQLAEYDLAERGPGAIGGSLQSGWPEFRYATMDPKLLARVQRALEAVGDVAVAAGSQSAHLE